MPLKVFTGASGSTGRYISSNCVPLKTRLEGSVSEMVAELASIGQPIQSFIHLAAMVPTAQCEANPELALELNVEGAKRWYEAACRVGVKHFVFASSSHVYGRVTPGAFVTPEQEVNPINLYGSLKAQAERELLELSRSQPKTKLTIARVFSVLSRAMRPGFLLTAIHARAKRRDYSAIPGLYAVRDFLDAEDVASLLERVAEWSSAPSVVHICSGQPTPIIDVVSKVFHEYSLSTDGLVEAPAGPNDVPWMVGWPTNLP